MYPFFFCIKPSCCKLSYAEPNSLSKSLSKLIVYGINSPPRQFYARLTYQNNPYICGASIIQGHFLVTAAECVKNSHADDVFIEVGNFSKENSAKTFYSVEKIIISPTFTEGTQPRMDLALIKTKRKIWGALRHRLPLCPTPIPEHSYPMTLLGTAGMGLTELSISSHTIPEVLQETLLVQIKYTNENSNVLCRTDNICTKPFISKSNICLMDEGGPLYKFRCGSLEPECLYGVASYSLRSSNETWCDGGSFFTNVYVFFNWIQRMLITN